MKFFAALIVVILLSSLKKGEEPRYKVEHTFPQWQAVFFEMNSVEAYLDSSNLPLQDVKRMERHIEALKGDFGSQLGPQIQMQARLDSATKIKAHIDSLKHK